MFLSDPPSFPMVLEVEIPNVTPHTCGSTLVRPDSLIPSAIEFCPISISAFFIIGHVFPAVSFED